MITKYDQGAVIFEHKPAFQGNIISLIIWKDKYKDADMLVPLITFETISKLYGESFAKVWFRPVSAVQKSK